MVGIKCRLIDMLFALIIFGLLYIGYRHTRTVEWLENEADKEPKWYDAID